MTVLRLALVIVIVIAIGCASRPPCDEPLDEPPGDVAQIASHVEPANVKLVHYVSFDMGPVQETLTGYMILRAPDALRLYGMSETGQKVFDVALLRGRVTRLYRAPFLKDDRLLDFVVAAAEKIFLLRPPRPGVEFFHGGRAMHLRWLKGEKFSACFMDWSSDGGVYAPRRIHFRSEEGPYPYELRMKLIDAKVLPAPPPDSLFEPRD
jgi:hypothetical protein